MNAAHLPQPDSKVYLVSHSRKYVFTSIFTGVFAFPRVHAPEETWLYGRLWSTLLRGLPGLVVDVAVGYFFIFAPDLCNDVCSFILHGADLEWKRLWAVLPNSGCRYRPRFGVGLCY